MLTTITYSVHKNCFENSGSPKCSPEVTADSMQCKAYHTVSAQYFYRIKICVQKIFLQKDILYVYITTASPFISSSKKNHLILSETACKRQNGLTTGRDQLNEDRIFYLNYAKSLHCS